MFERERFRLAKSQQTAYYNRVTAEQVLLLAVFKWVKIDWRHTDLPDQIHRTVYTGRVGPSGWYWSVQLQCPFMYGFNLSGALLVALNMLLELYRSYSSRGGY